MPTIEIDDEVYAALAARARPFIDTTPNSVLRHLLNLNPGAGTPTPTERPTARKGQLISFLAADLLLPGERLTWIRERTGTAETATVGHTGRIIVNGVSFNTPSGAAQHIAGHSVNGWLAWKVERTGETLDDLRTKLEAARNKA